LCSTGSHRRAATSVDSRACRWATPARSRSSDNSVAASLLMGAPVRPVLRKHRPPVGGEFHRDGLVRIARFVIEVQPAGRVGIVQPASVRAGGWLRSEHPPVPEAAGAAVTDISQQPQLGLAGLAHGHPPWNATGPHATNGLTN